MTSPALSRWLWTATVSALLVSCATTPPQQKAAYDQAQDEVQRLQADPLANQAAAKALSEARMDLANADAAAKNHMTDDAIHWSYLATREAQIGEAMTADMRARQQIAQADEERNRIVQQAQRHRTELAEQQAQRAEQRAQQAEQQLAQLKAQQQNEQTQAKVAAAQQQALAAEQQAETAQKQAQQQAERSSQQAQQEVAKARQQAQQQVSEAQQQAGQARREEQETRQQLQALQAKATDRGMVIILGNSFLFATGKDTIEPGALPTLHRVAQFMQAHPKEKLRVEGFTDSRGTDEFNDALSQRRAQAVAKALQSDGVDASRIQAIGRGKSLPVASNSTVAGRQQNRRVEIVFSNREGEFGKEVASGP